MAAADDIVCLLQDLGKELSVDVIANFILRNPEIEDLVAAKMGSILSVDPPAPSSSANLQEQSSIPKFMPDLNLISIAGSLCSGLDFSSKMIFVVNMELNMGRGKQCAQVAHAALGLYIKITESTNNREEREKLNKWISFGQKKIVVKANNLKQLLSIQEEANKAKLPNILITDAGCTQIPPGSKTVLAIFGSNEQVDMVTGALKLLW